jgi:NhaA family Na+:H+ antiporter
MMNTSPNALPSQSPETFWRAPRRIRPLLDFLHTESAGGIVLVVAAVVGLVWANSPFSSSFNDLWSTDFTISVAGHGISMDLRHWLNDGLMTFFFFVVGLEIKRELVEGELADKRQAMLPAIAAVGGMIVPALLFLALAGGSAERSGWGIPMATDIALALGVLSLFGSKVPASGKVFLLALAIVDDIGAILVIAIFYSKGFHPLPFAVGVVAILATAGLQRLGVFTTWPYLLLSVTAWVCIHESGVHATLVGVVLGLMATTRPRCPEQMIDEAELADLSTVEAAEESMWMARSAVSTVEWMEHKLHPWTSFVIVPLFAMANMGVTISGATVEEAVASPAARGIAVGLVIGKPLGILLAVLLGVRLFKLPMPEGVSMATIAALGAIAGIGFTVSLFVAELAYSDAGVLGGAKLAILVASVLAATIGAVAVNRMGSSSS